MSARTFLDTNVLVYGVSNSELVKRDIAQSLVEQPGTMISTQVLSEFGNVLTRKLGFPVADAAVLVANTYRAFETVTVTPAIVLDAFRVSERYGYRLFDSQIIAAALAAGATELLSEDLQYGQIIDGTLKIRSPFRSEAQAPVARYRAKPRRGRTR
jgi:predicted nucleic acid-binding protein